MIRQFWNHPWTFWALLALPSLPIVNGGLTGAAHEGPIHPSGEFAARFMIVALMLTPLRMLFPRARPLAWLMRRRRYLGVAAAGYAALHLAYYLRNAGDLSALARDALEVGIWTGWLAFLIFVPLAATSNDLSVRRLGRRWKMLQRLVYVAAIATLIHWVFVMHALEVALLHFLPLAGLEAYRLLRGVAGRQVRTAT